MFAKKPTFEQLAPLYQAHGLEVTPTLGSAWYCQTQVCAMHDGVPYCMDAHGGDDIEHGVRHRALMIERYHEKIKAIYDYCVQLNIGDIWVLCGGGMQLQAFFGNSTGYLAILYLDLEDLDQQAASAEYMAAVGNQSHTLQVNWLKNDVHFENKFSIEGVKLRTHKVIYGDDD